MRSSCEISCYKISTSRTLRVIRKPEKKEKKKIYWKNFKIFNARETGKSREGTAEFERRSDKTSKGQH